MAVKLLEIAPPAGRLKLFSFLKLHGLQTSLAKDHSVPLVGKEKGIDSLSPIVNSLYSKSRVSKASWLMHELRNPPDH